jgi:hypothetical protein
MYLVGGLVHREDTYCAGTFKQSVGAGNRVGIGLLYRPARLLRLAELIPWNRFLGSVHCTVSTLARGPAA